ncbi:MAG: ThiF family adenylyltransferase [Gemmatimonadetes bacterium]|nr:ThiF family adenylyltransferase [Gemmatimonadota bacterium]
MAHITVHGGHVLYVGAGGNIGSHAVALLARSRHVRHLTLVDPDTYTPRNLANQAITRGMVGRPKVTVLGEVARAINPTLSLTAHHCAVEELPLGMLRADLVLSGVDSRAARQHVNEVASRLGIPWVDAGVQADGLLARVERFEPGATTPCLECSWDDADYAALEQRYPCDGAPHTAPSGSPPALGALVASMQVLEGERLLRGDDGGLAPGEQVVLSSAHHRHFRTAHRRNPECRMGDHDRWDIAPLHLGPGESPAAVLLTIAHLMPCGLDFTWSVFGRHRVRSSTCASCGASRSRSAWCRRTRRAH